VLLSLSFFFWEILTDIWRASSFAKQWREFGTGITFRSRDGREKAQTPEQKIRCVIAREKVNDRSDGEKTSFRNMA